MKREMLMGLLASLAVVCTWMAHAARLDIAPACTEEGEVTAYRVTVNGKPLPLYSSRDEHWEKEYHFGTFDFEGKVEIRIQSRKPLTNVRVLPAEKFGVGKKIVSEHEMVLTAERPFRISVEPDGRKRPLLLFANAPEKDTPSPDTPNVVYIPAGVHRKGCLKLTTGQTLYLAPGAILHAGIDAEGDNITICGRGILAGESYKRFCGPNAFPVNVQNGRNIVIRDIVIRNPWSWVVVLTRCRGVLIDNLKICASNMVNDDGIDIVNTSDITIRNSFFRTQDDVFAIKGIMESREPCEDIVVEDCVVWGDRANILRVGYECDAAVMRNIVMRDNEIIHFSPSYRKPTGDWVRGLFVFEPAGGMEIADCRFEDFTIHSQGTDMNMVVMHMFQSAVVPSIYRTHLLPDRGNAKHLASWSKKRYKTYGNIRNITFRDLKVVGEKGNFRGEIYVAGRSATERVSHVSFENVTYFGERLSNAFPLLTVGKFADDITIK